MDQARSKFIALNNYIYQQKLLCSTQKQKNNEKTHLATNSPNFFRWM